MNIDKNNVYNKIIPQINSLISGEENVIGALANVSALLHDNFPYFFWVGFYLVKGNFLHLGPFQGNVACYKIEKGKGVCGYAFEHKETIIVNDVNLFKGHIACSSLSKSEIVVPILKNNKVVAVIDVDSKELNSFDKTDAKGLEAITTILSDLF